MACEFFDDIDLEKMVNLAIRWSEARVPPSPEEISQIADGDDDIVLTIRGLAEMRFLLWQTVEGGMSVLRQERQESEQELL